MELHPVFDSAGLAAIDKALQTHKRIYSVLSGNGAAPIESLRSLYCNDFCDVAAQLSRASAPLGWTSRQRNIAVGFLKHEFDLLYGLPSLVELPSEMMADWEAFVLSEAMEPKDRALDMQKRL